MKPDEPLPQEAFRKKPVTDEDKYFEEREREILEDLQDARNAQRELDRHCLSADCNNQLMERVVVDSVEIDKCPKCGGVWLDPGELDLLLNRSKGSKNALTRFFHNLAGHYDE